MSAVVDLQQVMALAMAPLRQRNYVTPRQWQVCAHIRDCRTPVLGGQRHRCSGCGYERVRYHSCRDRHCPKCQGQASAQWAERQRAQVLPVNYHHLVFTIPSALNGWVGQLARPIYDQLFASAWASLSAFAANHRRLGGQAAMSAVLHTWGQALTRHVHLHCLVPAGVLSARGDWRVAQGEYLFPVRALSRRFRGHFVAGLRARACAGELAPLSGRRIDAMLDDLMNMEWVVYSKPCLGHTERVVDYLARYTHRIALSDARLVGIDNGRVALRYLDYRDGRENKVMWLDAEELARRFLLHVLPKGFMRVRHFGYLANRCRRSCLQRIRAIVANERVDTQCAEIIPAQVPVPAQTCPSCQSDAFRFIAEIAPRRRDSG